MVVKAEEVIPSPKQVSDANKFGQKVSQKLKDAGGISKQSEPMTIKSKDQEEIDKFVSEKRAPGKFNAAP